MARMRISRADAALSSVEAMKQVQKPNRTADRESDERKPASLLRVLTPLIDRHKWVAVDEPVQVSE